MNINEKLYIRRIKMSIELKVKTKHLAEEARIIRFEEKKFTKRLRADIAYNYDSSDSFVSRNKNYKTFYDLYTHRVNVVRNEQRASYLARAFIEGKEYNRVEHTRNPDKYEEFFHIITKRVAIMVAKYDAKYSYYRYKYEKEPNYADALLKAIREWCDARPHYDSEMKRNKALHNQ